MANVTSDPIYTGFDISNANPLLDTVTHSLGGRGRHLALICASMPAARSFDDVTWADIPFVTLVNRVQGTSRVVVLRMLGPIPEGDLVLVTDAPCVYAATLTIYYEVDQLDAFGSTPQAGNALAGELEVTVSDVGAADLVVCVGGAHNTGLLWDAGQTYGIGAEVVDGADTYAITCNEKTGLGDVDVSFDAADAEPHSIVAIHLKRHAPAIEHLGTLELGSGSTSTSDFQTTVTVPSGVAIALIVVAAGTNAPPYAGAVQDVTLGGVPASRVPEARALQSTVRGEVWQVVKPAAGSVAFRARTTASSIHGIGVTISFYAPVDPSSQAPFRAVATATGNGLGVSDTIKAGPSDLIVVACAYRETAPNSDLPNAGQLHRGYGLVAGGALPVNKAAVSERKGPASLGDVTVGWGHIHAHDKAVIAVTLLSAEDAGSGSDVFASSRGEYYVFGGESGNTELADFDTHPVLVEAVLNTIGTWARSEASDNVAEGIRNGYWAASLEDQPINPGSRLWLVQRGKQDTASLNAIVAALQTALRWLVDDHLAASVEVSGVFGDRPDTCYLSVTVSEPDGTSFVVRFPDVWANRFFVSDEA